MKYKIIRLPIRKVLFETDNEIEANRVCEDIMQNDKNILKHYYWIEDEADIAYLSKQERKKEKVNVDPKKEENESFEDSLCEVVKAIKKLFNSVN